MNILARMLPGAAITLALLAPAAHAQQHELAAMMEKMHHNTSAMADTGNPDVDFAMAMREHHQGALDMAQWELDKGKDPKMKAMARSIISAQKKEIAHFDAYLAKHGHHPGGQGAVPGKPQDGHSHSR